MRHRIAGKQFNRDTKGRKALLRGLVRNLVVYGHIVTTESKAKEVKRIADKLMAIAKVGDLSSRRQLHEFFGKRDVVNSLVDSYAPLFTSRNSGFSTTKTVGLRRGDNSKMVEVRFLELPPTVGSLKAPKEAPVESSAKATKQTVKQEVKESSKSAEKSTKPKTKKVSKKKAS